jgi:hypothetical protein
MRSFIVIESAYLPSSPLTWMWSFVAIRSVAVTVPLFKDAFLELIFVRFGVGLKITFFKKLFMLLIYQNNLKIYKKIKIILKIFLKHKLNLLV